MPDAPDPVARATDAAALRSGRCRVWWWVIGGVLAVGAVVAALVFQPWLLFIDVRVDEEIPAASAVATPIPPSAGASSPPSARDTPLPSAPPVPAGPVEVSHGTLVSHEHETTGTVRVIRLPDGSRQLAIENLDTTNGPDVHVWLSAGPLVEGFDGWFTAGGHPYVDLGMIKGNQGNQLYDIPGDVDLGAYPTVDLWCVQFSVSFGAAALVPS
ncbi:MAG TPA: DM13 domain-containing protein [Agromyces mariniharenae]|nr:DM13 domain-containing protein [Agromyces mariniharenae]